jgi:hypothetical protein
MKRASSATQAADTESKQSALGLRRARLNEPDRPSMAGTLGVDARFAGRRGEPRQLQEGGL